MGGSRRSDWNLLDAEDAAARWLLRESDDRRSSTRFCGRHARRVPSGLVQINKTFREAGAEWLTYSENVLWHRPQSLRRSMPSGTNCQYDY